MKHLKTLLVIVFSLVLGSQMAPAQGLQTLQKASEIQTGELSNGVSYYLATNTTSKGYANFALVQKEDADQAAVRGSLKSLPHFTKQAPYSFMASHGVGYKRYGYISYPGNSAVFCFEDVPIYDSAASDSTLLLIFDLIQTSSAPQAVIICGDIENSGITDKIKMLSLTTLGQRPSAKEYVEKEWKPSQNIRFVHTRNSTKDVAGVQVVYSSPRPPKEYLNTVQPLVTRMYSTILGYILQKRAYQSFIKAGIPLADTYFKYTAGSESSSDEKYRFAVYTDSAKVYEATSILAQILADMDVHGAGMVEYQEAKNRLIAESTLNTQMSNRAYVQKCVSAFLYGSDLASASAMGDFFKDRKIDSEKDLSLFNRFAAAIIDPQKGLTLNVQTPSDRADKDSLLACFRSGWNPSATPPEVNYGVSLSDTSKLNVPKGHKVRLKSEETDPISGGKLWTFSNGMRVIYKNGGTKGQLSYGFMFNGGLPEIPDLEPSESAFASDIAQSFKMAGISPTDFRTLLQDCGIYYNLDITLTDMRIVGTAPTSSLDLLLKSLLTYCNSRQIGEEYFELYKSSEKYKQQRARLTQNGIKAVIDSIMAPDFEYPETKNTDYLEPDLMYRVDRYLNARFANANDGIIVLVGQMDEDDLQKTLCKYLGHFNTSDTKVKRPRVRYNLNKGWTTFTIDAAHSSVGTGETSVNIAMAALRPYSMRSYAAFRMASMALKKAVIDEMAGKGYMVNLSTEVNIFPSEKVSLLISCRPCLESGLPLGVEVANPLAALSAARSGILKTCNKGISASELKAYKAALLNDMGAEVENPRSLINMVLLRYAEGRDIVSNYADGIKAVTEADVLSALKDLDSGCKVEYVIK